MPPIIFPAALPASPDPTLAPPTPRMKPSLLSKLDQLTQRLEEVSALMNQEGPKGQVAGNNQFSVYVGANPLEHLASGMQKYSAGKAVREGREGLEKLSKSKEGGLMRVQESMMQQMQAEALRKKEEEEERKRNGYYAPLQRA